MFSAEQTADRPLSSGTKIEAPENSTSSNDVLLLPMGLASVHAFFFFFFSLTGKFSLTGELYSYHKFQDISLLEFSGVLFVLLAQEQLSNPLFKCPQDEEDRPSHQRNNNFHLRGKMPPANSVHIFPNTFVKLFALNNL